jgi:hypothetical protein
MPIDEFALDTALEPSSVGIIERYVACSFTARHCPSFGL